MKRAQAQNITEQNWPNPLRQLLEKTGIKQFELAQKAQLAQSAISNYLSGERVPGAWELHRLANALGCTMEFLMTGKHSADWSVNEVQGKSNPQEARRLARQLLEMAKALEIELGKY